MKKKVCMILGNPFVNDNRVLREAETLAKAGFKVRLFASYGAGLPSYEKVDKFEVIRLPVKNYSPFRLKIYPYYTEYLKSYKRLVGEKADVYHCHDLDTLLIGYLAAKANGAKVVYDSHEYWPNKTDFTQNIMRITYLLIKRPVEEFIEKKLIYKVNGIITVNDSLATLLSTHYKIPKPVALYNYPLITEVHKSAFLRKKLNFLREDKIILYLGGMVKYRGLENLIHSMKFLSSEIKLVVLGYGPLRSILEKLIIANRLTEQVYLLEAVEPRKVVEVSSGADVGVSPIQNASTSYYYSSPNKVFEYLAAGLPIAVSNFPEMKKIVKENDVGTVFDPENPKDIARAIEEILADETSYKRMKKNALKVAKEKYNWELEEKKLINLYRGLIS